MPNYCTKCLKKIPGGQTLCQVCFDKDNQKSTLDSINEYIDKSTNSKSCGAAAPWTRPTGNVNKMLRLFNMILIKVGI